MTSWPSRSLSVSWRASGHRMCLGQRGDQLLVQQRPRHQTRAVHRRTRHAQIQLAGHEALELDGVTISRSSSFTSAASPAPPQQPRQPTCAEAAGKPTTTVRDRLRDALYGLRRALGELQMRRASGRNATPAGVSVTARVVRSMS